MLVAAAFAAWDERRVPVANSVVVMVCRSSDDGLHRTEILSMSGPKLPVSSFLLAATSFDEINQVISFLCFCFSTSTAFAFFVL